MQNIHDTQTLESSLIKHRQSALTWTGIIAAALSTLNLFGTIGIISISEWFENFLYAYSVVMHGIVGIILYPLKIVIAVDFLSWHRDLIIIAFFFFNRFITDIIVFTLSETVFSPAEPLKENQYLDRPKLRKTINTLQGWEHKVHNFFKKRQGFVFQKLITLLIVALIVYVYFDSDPPSLDPSYPAWYPIVWFFLAMYSIPFVVFFIYMIRVITECFNYLFGYVSYIFKRISTPQFEPPPQNYLKMMKSQFVYDIKFTFAFLALIGVNYQLYEKAAL